jgi:hypothetical protein
LWREIAIVSKTINCKALRLPTSRNGNSVNTLDFGFGVNIILLLLLLLLKLYLHTVFSSGFNMQQTKLDKLQK